MKQQTNIKKEQRFISKKHNVLTKEVNNIVQGANNDKRIQSIDSKETYAYAQAKIQYVEKKVNETK